MINPFGFYELLLDLENPMVRFLSMLRGINVGGKNKVTMRLLKQELASLGLDEVQTYVQSGNVVFTTKLSAADVKTKIERAIKSKFGFDVLVFIRSGKELADVITNSPYRQKDETKLHITFLSQKPKEIPIHDIDSAKSGAEEFSISGKEIYLFCPYGYGVTKLSNNFFERKLKVEATTRNWRTVNALLSMLSGADTDTQNKN